MNTFDRCHNRHSVVITAEQSTVTLFLNIISYRGKGLNESFPADSYLTLYDMFWDHLVNFTVNLGLLKKECY